MSRCIIFIHNGYHEYLYHTISITKKFNPTTRIILLGDDQNKTIANQLDIDFYQHADYHEAVPYYHLSVNGRQYEKFCFDRWFIIYNFLELHELDSFVHSDSDNMICYDVSEVSFENACIGDYKNNCAIIPNVFFSNRDTLAKLLDFYMELYNQKFKEFIRDIKPFTSTVVHENPPVQLTCMHYSDMYFFLHAITVLELDFEILPENEESDIIFNGNYTNHSIIVKDQIVVHGETFKRMFNIHFKGTSKTEIARFYAELTNTD